MIKKIQTFSNKILIKELYLQIFLVVMTVLMIILRFLLNEKGRTNPDSIRFMRTSKVFPEIDKVHNYWNNW